MQEHSWIGVTNQKVSWTADATRLRRSDWLMAEPCSKKSDMRKEQTKTPSHVRRDLVRRASDERDAPQYFYFLFLQAFPHFALFLSTTHPSITASYIGSSFYVITRSNYLCFYFIAYSIDPSIMTTQLTPSKQVRKASLSTRPPRVCRVPTSPIANHAVTLLGCCLFRAIQDGLAHQEAEL